jgi:hypothetical protein
MSSAKGFPAVPFFDHRLCCHLGYIRCIRHYLGASLLVHCTPLLATFPYQTLNNNDALVPAADIVYHIVIITGPFSCLELESTSHSAYWSPWLAEPLSKGLCYLTPACRFASLRARIINGSRRDRSSPAKPTPVNSELPLKLNSDSYSVYETAICPYGSQVMSRGPD